MSFRAARRGALVVLAGVVLAGPWLAPMDPWEQEDLAGARYLTPLTAAHGIVTDDGRTVVVTDPEYVDGVWRGDRNGRTLVVEASADAAQKRFYWLGTDRLGRDLASRLLHAIRLSVGVAVAATLLALGLGVLVGAAAALGGPGLDLVAMRFVDTFLAFPRIVLFLLVAAITRPSVSWLVVVLGATSWPATARLVRGSLRVLSDGPLVEAARAEGCSPLRIVLYHMLPQLRPLLGVTSVVLLADLVVLESALGFLGLGAPPPSVSLGTMIAAGRDAIGQAWWVAAWPSTVLVAVVLIARSVAQTGRPQTGV